MLSWYRDPDAPEVNASRRVGVTAIVEVDGGALVDRRHDDGSWAFLRASAESRELAVVPRAELAGLPLWPAARAVLDAYLADDGMVVSA